MACQRDGVRFGTNDDAERRRGLRPRKCVGGGSALDTDPAATLAETVEGESSTHVISSEVGEADAVEKSVSIEQNEAEDLTYSSEKEEATDIAAGSDNSDIFIPAAMERINEDVALTQPVAQQESTRSYFLAQTLESTKTVPIVSANLPLYTGASVDLVEPVKGEGDGQSGEEEGGEDSDESDLPASTVIAAESTVVGSFTYRGITFAVEPGGETVAAVAADYTKLPEPFLEEQTIVVPSEVTADYIDYYSVTRIADYAFASLTSEAAATRVISTEASDSERSGEISSEEGSDENEGITTLGIPASITSIGDDAFTGFDTLQYIVVEDGNPSYASYDGVLYNADLTCLLLVPEGRLGAVRVAPSVTEVKPGASSHCAQVESFVADPDSAAFQLLSESDLFTDIDIAVKSSEEVNIEALQAENPSIGSASLSERQTLAATYYTVTFTSAIPTGGSLSEVAKKTYDSASAQYVSGDVKTGRSSLSYMSTTNLIRIWVGDPASGAAGSSLNFRFNQADAPNNEGFVASILAGWVQGYTFMGWSCGSSSYYKSSAQAQTDGYQLFSNRWFTISGATTLDITANYRVTTTIGFKCIGEGTAVMTNNSDPSTFPLKDYGAEYVFQTVWPIWSYETDKDGYCNLKFKEKSTDTTFGRWLSLKATPADGWYFAGWSSYESGTPLNSVMSDSGTTQAVRIFYAVFKASSYTITWNANGGKWDDNDTSKKGPQTYGNALALWGTDPSYTGRNFAGWYTSASGGSKVSAADTVPAEDTTYFAHWTLKTSVLTFNLHDGAWKSGETLKSPITATYNSAMPGIYKSGTTTKMTVPTKTGYTFAGFYDAATNGNMYYKANLDSNTTWNKDTTNSTELHAHWTLKTSALAFDLQDATSGTAPTGKTATYNSAMPTYGNAAPSKTGYTFGGFYDATSGGTQYYTAALASARNWDKDTTDGTTLYARWTAKKSALTFDLQSATSGTAPTGKTAEYGSAMPTYGNTAPSRTGYTFEGFYDTTNAAGGGTQYYTAALASARNWNKDTTDGTTLYARWTAKKSALTFDLQSATSGTAPTGKTAEYGSAMPTYGNTAPSRTGYTFGGFYDTTNAAGGGTQYYTAALASARNWDKDKTDGTTLYARWTPKVLKIELDKNDDAAKAGTEKIYLKYANGWFSNSDATAGMTEILAPTWTGHTFKGFATTQNATTAQYFIPANPNDSTVAIPTSKTLFSDDAKLYAVWDSNEYKIEYVMNDHGVKPANAPAKYTYGQATTLPKAANVEGWTFGGWYTDANCTEGNEASITSSTIGDITVYAKWTKNKHTVHWDYDEADGKTNFDKEYPYKEPITTIEPGAKKGYSFSYWEIYIDNELEGTIGALASYTMPDSDVTFKAKWDKYDATAVSLLDERLGKANKTIYYWPERGYVKNQGDLAEISPGEGNQIVTIPSVDGYRFEGYFTTSDTTDNDPRKQMIDSHGCLLTGNAPDESATWYAHWTRESCPVDLLDEYADFTVDVEGSGMIAHAKYKTAFKSSVESGNVAVPKRAGYTFMGYYDTPNKEVGVDGSYDGFRWIDERGRLTEAEWDIYPADLKSATLYAAWRLDDCNVAFDVKANVASNTETVTIVNEDSIASTTWNYGRAKKGIFKPSETTFYRTGYTFGGWYYLKDANGSDVESNRVFVTDTAGNPDPEIWMPDLEEWEIVKNGITLYPHWTAKKYTIVFDDDYPKIDGLEAPEKTEKSIEVYYDQELDLSEFNPEFFPYTFAGWYTKTNQLFEGTHMTDNGNGTKRFTPRGAYASMSQIDLVAHWNKMDEATYTLFWKIPGESEIQQSVHDYGYIDTVKFNGTEAPVAPAGSGYRFEGWVEVADYDTAQRALASDKPYMEGDTIDGWKPISNWDRYFVAKWTQRAFSVSFSTTSHEAFANGESWIMNTDTLENWKGTTDALSWEEACRRADQSGSDMATGIFYNIDMPSFVLPDVKRKGQVFEGWKLLDAEGNPTGEAARGIVIEPSKQDAQGMRDLVYVPVFKDALYTIILDANVYGEEMRFEGDKAIPYSGEFTFPYPATLSTGSVFVCWGEDSNTNSTGTEKFSPMQTVKLAPTYDELGEMKAFGLAHLANEQNEIRLYAVWNNATYNVDVPLFANLAIDTDRGDVIAGTNTIAPDPENADTDAVYRIESIRYEPLKNDEGVYAFQREGATDKVYLSVYAGLNTGEATDLKHLLYAENIDKDGGTGGEVTYTDASGNTAKAKPLLIELGGTTPVVYGRTAPENQASLESVTNADAPYGFVTFSQNDPLTIRYGLYFENPQTRKDFASNGKYDWRLPKNDGANKSESIDPANEDYGRRTAWSGNTVDVAKLHYTVSLVGATK